MRLSELTSKLGGARISGSGDPDIRSISLDSRKTRSGDLFIALPGSHEDGRRYAADAIEKGAVAVALPTDDVSLSVPRIVFPSIKRLPGEAADILTDHPSRKLALIGVTGTNGKTTTAYLLRHIFNHAERRCGMAGTIEVDFGGECAPSSLTTLDAVEFTSALARMVDAGCRAAAVEVSSHALDQERVWPHRFACGVFTNLTRDHLDYHGSMENYADAKKILFDRLSPDAWAVMNFDDPHSAHIASGTKAGLVGYSLEPDARIGKGRIAAEIIQSDLAGQEVRVRTGDGRFEFFTPLVGRHNVQNALGALMAARCLGVSLEAVFEALANFPGVPGRLERIAGKSGVTVFVDFAHTDDALSSVLRVLRPLTPGRLITVFGCGGDRDRGKRPLMAKAAEKWSDRVVATSDNPRTEDPNSILDDIIKGFEFPKKAEIDPDRPSAIRKAVAGAAPGDVVLIAGKGHEDYQIIGTTKHPMDDRKLALGALAAGGGGTECE